MSRHFLLDGYNILRQMPGVDELSLEDGRKALIRFVEANQPQGSHRNEVTVVFDGQEAIWWLASSNTVRVIFSRGESADDLIKRTVEESTAPRDIVLVTDDRDLLYFCRTFGAESWSVAQFFAQAKKTGTRLRTGVAHPQPGEGKTIAKVFEDRVNRELKDLWLKPKK